MKNIANRIDKKLSIVLISSIAFTPLKYAVNSIIGQIMTLPNGLVTSMLWIIFLTICVIPILRRIRITTDAIAITCFIGLSWSLSLYTHSEYYSDWFSMFYKIFIRSIPYYFIARSIKDFTLLSRMLKKTAYFITLCISIVVVIKVFNGTMERYDMYLAYLTLPAAILSLVFLRAGFEWKLFLNFCLSLIFIIMMGTRGPLVCVVVCLLFCLLERVLHKSTLASLLALLLMILAFLGIIYSDEILNALYNLAKHLGLSVRIIETIQQRAFFSSSGRSKIYDVTFQLISNYPVTGTGIIADRLNISPLYQGSNQNFLGAYPHLIFLEFVLQYGIILGGIIGVLLIILIGRCLLKSNYHSYYLPFITFLFIGFIPLLLSNSYLQSESFFVFLGLSVNGIRLGKGTYNND